MSYISQSQDPRRRATALAGTVAVHALLGVAIVTGMTIVGIRTEKPYDPPEFPLTPPTPTPTPPPQADPVDTRIVVPPIPQPIPQPPRPGPDVELVDPDDVIRVDTRPTPTPSPTAQPDPPRPRPSFTPAQAKPSNDPRGWISNEDYPADPLRRGIEGTAGYRLIVGTNGRVSSCEIVRSAGNGALDAATCRLLARRARFEPATDETGAKVVGSYTGTVRWDIPD